MTKSPQSERSKPRQLVLLCTLLLCCAVLSAILIMRQRVYDSIRLFHYTPPAAVSALATADTMTGYTRHVFYVNHPQLLSSVSSFRDACPEDTSDIVLGCYYAGQDGIFIYDVSDPSLSGIQEVTAAHEVLHALYARLSSAQRNHLDQELESYYLHGLSNPVVAAEVKVYERTEPGSVYDEMSCTFGTEIATLPAGLNEYYRQFFVNRQVIVGFEQHYQAAFTNRQTQIAADDNQLATLKQQITTAESTLGTERSQIEAERTGLSAMAQSDPQSYNAQIVGFNQQVTSYNAAVSSLQNSILAYNQLVITRNAIAGDLDTLITAINTKVPSSE